MSQPGLLSYLMTINVDVGPPVIIGDIGTGVRRCVPLLGGTVEGRYRGVVLPGGSDWQTVAADGTLDIQARYILDLDDGQVEVQSNGLRSGPPDILARLAAGEAVSPELYYFRTAMRFHTASPALADLNHMLAVAVGERRPDQVQLTVHQVL